MANTYDISALVISLADKANRRDAMTEMMANIKLPWTFLDASKVDTPSSYSVDQQRQLDEYGRVLADGEVGCAKSHIAALEIAAAKPSGSWTLILEDDVWLDPAFDLHELVETMIAKDITFIRLFCRRWVPGKLVSWIAERQILRLKTEPYGCQAYLMSPQAAQAILDSFDAIVRPIDDQIGRFWEHGLPLYILFPFPVVERLFPSTLALDRDDNVDRATKTLKRRYTQARDAISKRVANLLRA